MPPFHLKKVEDLASSEITQALNNFQLQSLKDLCLELKIAKKIHNSALKKRIKYEHLDFPFQLHKAIYGVTKSPWNYPRSSFLKRNQKVPNTCA